MKFSQMEYKRPDFEKTYAKYEGHGDGFLDIGAQPFDFTRFFAMYNRTIPASREEEKPTRYADCGLVLWFEFGGVLGRI